MEVFDLIYFQWFGHQFPNKIVPYYLYLSITAQGPRHDHPEPTPHPSNQIDSDPATIPSNPGVFWRHIVGPASQARTAIQYRS